MVAIKVIEHNADDNSKMDGLRESLLCSSIQHPNVVRPLVALHALLPQCGVM